VVMVSFSKYLPWQAMHFLQHSTYFSKTELWSNLSATSALHDWRAVMNVLTKISGTPLEHLQYSPDLTPCNFWAFPTMKREFQGQNNLFHYPPEAHGKWSTACFREVGGALYKVHHFPKEVLQKRDHHYTSTKFQLRVMRSVHKLCKWPS
jgi:hypothetical protein